MRKRLIHLMCLLFLLPFFGNAGEYKMSNLTNKDGLFGDRIFKSFRDKDGYLWMLGIGGVARYDGKYITNYLPGNSMSKQYIKGDRLYTICQDYNGTIWIGGNGGLNRFDPVANTFTPIKMEGINDIRFVGNYSADSIWVSGMGSKNFLLDVHSNIPTKREEKVIFSASAKDQEGNIWLSTFDGRIFKNYQATKIDYHLRIRDICFTPSGSLYMATDNGMTVDRHFIKRFSSSNKGKVGKLEFWLSGRIVYTIAYYEGCIWAGTDNGLNQCELNNRDLPNRIQDYYSVTKSSFSITNNLIQDVFCDKEGILWISTYGGVNKIDPSKQWFESFRYDPEENNTLHDNYIFPIHGDKNGCIWMGSYTSGVSCFNTETGVFTYYNKENSVLDDNFIVQIYSDDTGKTWITTSRKVYHYKKGELKPVEFSNFKKVHTIKSIIQNADGTYWMGSYNRLFKITQLTNGEYQVEKEIKLNDVGAIFCLHTDTYQRLWLGCAHGLYLLQDIESTNFIAFKKKNYPILKSHLIQTMQEDSYGNLWLGSDNGLYCIENDSIFKTNPQHIQFKAFFKEDGMSSSYVPGLVQGNDGEMWVSSWKELMKYDPKGLGIGKFTHYSSDEGIVSEKFNRFGNYVDTLTNMAYFGSANGVNYFSIDNKTKTPDSARVLIHRILLDGEELNYGKYNNEFFLDNDLSGSSDINIHFGSSSLLSPLKQVFAWKLVGRDTEWNYTRKREIILQDLTSGNYQLQIGVVINKKVEPSFEMNFEVQSNKIKYLLFSILLVICFGVVYYLIQLKRSKKTNTKYEYSKLTSDKSSEIVDQLNLVMKEQKLYLNPELTVNDLAGMVGVNSTKLSQVLNDYLQTRFYEYVNKYRVEEFVACLEKDENKKMTLIALSEKCGFSSKSSFYRFFKEVKGTTPAQYVKSQKN